MGQRWADEQTLHWPIQDLQPWANRAAYDGPMEGQCIRAIWVGFAYVDCWFSGAVAHRILSFDINRSRIFT